MNTAAPKLLILGLLATVTVWSQEPVRYVLEFPNASHHEAEVLATFSGIGAAPLDVVISRSSPGRYSLHEFAKNIYNVRATDAAGKALAVVAVGSNEWRIPGHDGTVQFRYTLFGDAVNGTYNAIDASHAHLNGPATFVWARGWEQRPVRVKLIAPAQTTWSVASQLDSTGDGWWSASSRDLLLDSPIEFSSHKTREWRTGDTRFRMVLHSPASDVTASEFARYCEAVVIEAEGVFGGFPRYDAGLYTFLLDNQPYDGVDAMEHRNSTSINSSTELDRRNYSDVINSVAHEFFHSWNVERIRPQSLEPFDFERANPSGELWFAEGFTNYYAPLILKRIGIYTLDDFATEVGEALNRLWTTPARLTTNAPGVSRMAVFADGAEYTDPTNQANTFLTYYYYGEALALGIDLSIRSSFPGKSLDDWMRAMWRSHPDVQRPYTDQDLRAALGQVTSPQFAAEIFERYIDGHALMDYESLLAKAGLALRKAQPGEVWFGAPRMGFGERGAAILGVTLKGSPAYAAGLDRGDRVVSVDGKDVEDQKTWDKILRSHKPGEQSRLTIDGRMGRRVVTLIWQESPNVQIVPYESLRLAVSREAEAFRKGWLGSKAMHPLPKLP